MYRSCFIEQHEDQKWYIMWPDNTKAWCAGYKTRGWAKRVLNELNC